MPSIESTNTSAPLKLLCAAMGSMLVTGLAAWFAFGNQSVTKDMLDDRFEHHLLHPHKDAVSRREFEIVREELREIKADVKRLLSLQRPVGPS